ncbi:hypothetical protein ACHAWF_016812, partial [Thalassiosira exigua]
MVESRLQRLQRQRARANQQRKRTTSGGGGGGDDGSGRRRTAATATATTTAGAPLPPASPRPPDAAAPRKAAPAAPAAPASSSSSSPRGNMGGVGGRGAPGARRTPSPAAARPPPPPEKVRTDVVYGARVGSGTGSRPPSPASFSTSMSRVIDAGDGVEVVAAPPLPPDAVVAASVARSSAARSSRDGASSPPPTPEGASPRPRLSSSRGGGGGSGTTSSGRPGRWASSPRPVADGGGGGDSWFRYTHGTPPSSSSTSASSPWKKAGARPPTPAGGAAARNPRTTTTTAATAAKTATTSTDPRCAATPRRSNARGRPGGDDASTVRRGNSGCRLPSPDERRGEIAFRRGNRHADEVSTLSGSSAGAGGGSGGGAAMHGLPVAQATEAPAGPPAGGPRGPSSGRRPRGASSPAGNGGRATDPSGHGGRATSSGRAAPTDDATTKGSGGVGPTRAPTRAPTRRATTTKDDRGAGSTTGGMARRFPSPAPPRTAVPCDEEASGNGPRNAPRIATGRRDASAGADDGGSPPPPPPPPAGNPWKELPRAGSGVGARAGARAAAPVPRTDPPRASSRGRPAGAPVPPSKATEGDDRVVPTPPSPPWASREPRGKSDGSARATSKGGTVAPGPNGGPVGRKPAGRKRPRPARKGGVPAWVRASALSDCAGPGDGRYAGEGAGGDEWEWIRCYLHEGGEGERSSATVDDPQSRFDGGTYDLPEESDDEKKVLMGNAWWSRSGSSSPPPSPSRAPASPDGDRGGGSAGRRRRREPPGDLAELSHLHEPAIVHALRARYEGDAIYTDTGAILLALNPFKKLDALYTRGTMERYWDDGRDGGGGSEEGGEGGGGGGDDERPPLPPHAYAVAARAYRSLLRALEARDGRRRSRGGRGDDDGDLGPPLPPRDQSILVSGESGAGKTVTTKIVMRCLSVLARRRAGGGGGDGDRGRGSASVEAQVLQSNPVLESFGNARTVRNDNSSRFGKFIEMSFRASSPSSSSSGGEGGGGARRGALLGAKIDFYLLEKVRLVAVNPGERCYHVFYEVLSPRGMDSKDKRRYKLTSDFGRGSKPLTPRDFRTTSASGTYDRRDGVDDSDTFAELRAAMDVVGFSRDDRDGIFRLVAALLHASNLTFKSDGGEMCDLYGGDGTSAAVAELMGVTEDALRGSVTTSVLEMRGEVVTKRLSAAKAEKALEATVKAAYGALFSYIVGRINRSIEVRGDDREDEACSGGGGGRREDVAAIGDNQEALDLIEAKRTGIFAVLDEQCRLPRRTDLTFAGAAYDACASNAHFAASRMQRSKGWFVVHHYAGPVEYDADGFLLKNKDELPKAASELLASSSVPLIAELARILDGDDASSSRPSSGGAGERRPPARRSSGTLARATVCGQFASQLRGLRARVEATEPHYVRCLKPNDDLVPDRFDEALVARQLNCAGVLPAMKVARAGFAARYPHAAFVRRYRPALGRAPRGGFGVQGIGPEALIDALSERLEGGMRRRIEGDAKLGDVVDVVAWGVQVGKTKVFLRAVAHEALEELRNSAMNEAATKLQAHARAFLCQNKFFLILGSMLTLQCFARMIIASNRVRQLRFQERSITIQKQWRCYQAWCHYQNVLYVAIWCQRFWRGGKVRERFLEIRQYRSSIVIQSAWRCHVFRQCHLQMTTAAIAIQCFSRVCAAVRTLKALKRQAKDMHSIAMERDRLRMEMRLMKRELEQARKRHHESAIPLQHSDSYSTTLTSASQEERIRKLAEECARKDREVQVLRREVESLRGSGRSVPSTLPLTVTVETASPSGKKPSRGSPEDLSFPPSGESSLTKSVGKHSLSPQQPVSTRKSPQLLPPSAESSLIKSVGLLPHSPSLLDTEVEDVPQLECSQISLPDSSIDQDERVNTSISQMTESSFIDCVKIDELPFHQAVQNDDKETLLEEIRSSSDIELGINSADSRGRTPLHIAVQCSNLELAKILLAHDAVANAQDYSGNTALHYANTPEMTQLLLEGGISPNIPNGDGLCSLHMSVKRRDFISVKHLLLHGADVNNADDEFWMTPMHLVARADSSRANMAISLRGPIAELLCEAKAPSVPDLNYQDIDGNTPLHHAASLVEEDAGILISLFLEHGSLPRIANNRGQTPIHLFCHNHAARKFVFYHEALHLMLVKGAAVNTSSSSGCTALHLALYHKDVEAAALLVRHGAQVNVTWKKPQKWESFWTDMGTNDVMPLDMLEDLQSLHKVLSEISTQQNAAPRRQRCMHCKAKFGMFARHHNCTHCGRSVCGRCCVGSLRQSFFPTLRSGETSNGMFKVCSLCEPILLSMIEKVPVPTTILSGGCDQSSL